MRFHVRNVNALSSITMNRLALALLGLCLGVVTAHADRRHFVWTYEAQTLKRGEAEIESYTTFSSTELDHASGQTATELQLELETGMTDRFDFGLYQVFAQEPDQALIYSGYKLRFRYRLWESGSIPFASTAYLEYKGKPDYSTHTFEAKWIAARTLGRFLYAFNPILEFEQEGSEWEVEPEYAAGIAWASGDLLSFGLEAKGSEKAHYLSPVIAHGIGDLWVAIGPAFRVSGEEDASSELQTRILFGIGVH